MERFKFSLIFKILFLFLYIIFLGNAIYNMQRNLLLSILSYFLFILIFVLENFFYSCIAFKKNIKVWNKFRFQTFEYVEIKEIKAFISIKQAFIIGADIDIYIVLKNDSIKKIHLGPIIRYNKLIKLIKLVSKNKCIKFNIIK